jgi:two-component system, NtrC family, response regulator AtoC
MPATAGRETAGGGARTPSTRAHPLTLLIVDDDVLLARLLKANVERPGAIEAEVAPSGEHALARLARGGIDALVTDFAMPEMDGVELVRRIRETDPALPVVIITAFATVELAVQAMRAGAVEFLQKPVNVDALLALIERAVAERPIREELARRGERRASLSADQCVVGDDAALAEVRRFAERIARVPGARVLITGESGTGKSMLARSIHELSGDVGRFVEVNCAALPAPLLETELFGHEKGAFTDAKGLKRGLIETADRGTLLLDEIGAMPLELQAKLLLFLESREIRRVGGVHPVPVRTRVIAATNERLHERVSQRLFRQDLLYRLDVATVEMPALRSMPHVIPQLAERFLRDLCAELQRPVPITTPRSFAGLVDFPWPGNARELRNAVERALIFQDGGEFVVRPPADVARAYAGLEVSAARGAVTLEPGLTLDEVERRYIGAMMSAASSQLGELARRLGISRKTLWEKRRRYGL